ncbi:MAG: TldD/PmbA family protein [Bacteroidales bacterium]|nr:TldD/PmbA family protein [Bacteroidales bacterium]
MFEITDNQLNELISLGLSHGGDWCDLYFERTTYQDLILRDSQVSAGGFSLDCGCGIRVLKSDKTGYAYSESLDYNSLSNAAKAASEIADGSRCNGRELCVCTRKAPSRYDQKETWQDSKASNFIPWITGLEQEIRSRDQRVEKVIISLAYSTSEIMMFNSLGEKTSDFRPLGTVMATVLFCKNDRKETVNVSRSFRCGAEMLSESLIRELADQATERLDDRFLAKRPKGGRMSVVMGAGASGILLHEAMGHAFEADFNRKGQSVFSGKMGSRICKEGIDIIDDGTIFGNRGSINFDDEGVPSQKTYMVRDGILCSYLHDRISAGYYGVEPTGNGRRESFRYHPIPRMRCTYMDSGNDGTVQDLISSVRKGVYVDEFSNGQVKIGEGDFTFYVKRGYMIENGKLTFPVKDINIIGNGPQALSQISGVASDLKIDDGNWTCGKEQSVAVSCGTASVLVNNLTVGGE